MTRVNSATFAGKAQLVQPRNQAVNARPDCAVSMGKACRSGKAGGGEWRARQRQEPHWMALYRTARPAGAWTGRDSRACLNKPMDIGPPGYICRRSQRPSGNQANPYDAGCALPWRRRRTISADAEVPEGEAVVKMSSGFFDSWADRQCEAVARLPAEDMKTSSTCPATPFHCLPHAAIPEAQATRGVLARAPWTQAPT